MDNFWHKYPYTDFHELNLDWVIARILELSNEFDLFKHLNQITYQGIWDITKQYPAWSIVDDGQWEYLSLKPVPAGIDISNREYWLVLGRYSEKIQKLYESKENDRVNFLPNASMIYYLDNTLGDDENDGSIDAPFKTLDHALEAITFNLSDVRIYVMHAGTYVCNATTFSAVNLHIHAQVSGVTIQFTNEGSFYGAHLNLKGYDSNNPMIITTTTSSKTVYMDGGDVSGNYLDLQCIFRMNGGYASFQNSIMRNIFCHGAFFIVDDNCVFKDLFTDTAPAIRIKGGFMMFGSNISFDLSQNQNGNLWLVRGGYVDITTQPTNTSGYTYTGENDVTHCTFITNDGTMAFFKGMVVTNTWGPHIITNMKILKRIVNTTTNVASNSNTTLGTFTVNPGYSRVDVCVLINAPTANIDTLVNITTTDGSVPSTSVSLIGTTGNKCAVHYFIESCRPEAYDVTVAIQRANGESVKCICDQLTQV